MIRQTMSNINTRRATVSPDQQRRIISPHRGPIMNNGSISGHPMLGNQINPRILGTARGPHPIANSPPRVNNQVYYNPTDNISRNGTQRASCSPPMSHQAIDNRITQQLEVNKIQEFKNPGSINNVRIIQSVQIPKSSSSPKQMRVSQSPVIHRHGQTAHKSKQASRMNNQITSQFQPRATSEKSNEPNAAHEEFIIQLLGESKQMKKIIQRLINDNTRVMKQYNKLSGFKDNEQQLEQLRKLIDHYQSQNLELKQQIQRLLKTPRIDDSQIQQCNKIIQALEVEVNNINPISQNSNETQQKVGSEQLINTISLRQKQISLLQQENQYLNQKLKQLLVQIHSIESRFQEEKLSIIEENYSFREAANQQISRLRMIIAQNKQLSKLRFSSPDTQSSSPKIGLQQNIQVDIIDTQVQISGGYQQFTKVRGSTPVKVRVTTTQIIDGEQRVQIEDTTQFLQFLDQNNSNNRQRYV